MDTNTPYNNSPSVAADDLAFSWAKSLNIGNSIYKEIPLGGTFRFANSDVVYKKYRSGFKRDGDDTSPMFKTGTRTAVFRLS